MKNINRFRFILLMFIISIISVQTSQAQYSLRGSALYTYDYYIVGVIPTTGFQAKFEYDFYRWLNIGVALGTDVAQSTLEQTILYSKVEFPQFDIPTANYRDMRTTRYIDVMVGFMPLNNNHNRITLSVGLDFAYMQQNMAYVLYMDYNDFRESWDIKTLRFQNPHFFEFGVVGHFSYDYIFNNGLTLGATLQIKKYFLEDGWFYPAAGLSIGYTWGDKAYKNKKVKSKEEPK